ncbi:MAG: nitrate reductase molybdenum cofactor assembly chaperone [Alphaproteobacteria bacterium]|nr:nitrate reductase molybdenum cofactor assembly chaperone [Alphaproteobacteria bacterium]
MKTYRVLARLLAYPDADLVAATAELAAVLEGEGLLPRPQRRALRPLLAELAAGDVLDLQAGYVDLFDRVRSLSLNLFEHVHGEGRERGQAMVELVELYRSRGLDVTARELPDHLPLVLEFLSLEPAAEAARLLAETAPVLALLAARLDKRGSAYAAVFHALLHLAGAGTAAVADDAAADEDSPEALDRAWEEAAVAFGPDGAPGIARGGDAAGCGRAQEWVARMQGAREGAGR